MLASGVFTAGMPETGGDQRKYRALSG